MTPSEDCFNVSRFAMTNQGTPTDKNGKDPWMPGSLFFSATTGIDWAPNDLPILKVFYFLDVAEGEISTVLRIESATAIALSTIETVGIV